MVYGSKDDKKARKVVVQKVKKEPEEPTKITVPVKDITGEPIKMKVQTESEEKEEDNNGKP